MAFGAANGAQDSCLELLWDGIARQADRLAICALLKAIGEAAERTHRLSPLLDGTQIAAAALASEPALRGPYGAANGSAIENLRAAIDRTSRLRLNQICPCKGNLAMFGASPFLDISEILVEDRSRPGHDALLGWVARGGQWAFWSMTEVERIALCRLAAASLAAGSDMVAKLAMRLGTALLSGADFDADGQVLLGIGDFERIGDGVLPLTFDRALIMPLMVETLRALERGRVIGPALYPGPRGTKIRVPQVLPQPRFSTTPSCSEN